MNPYKFAIIILTAITLTTAHGENTTNVAKIEGAFGKKLGDIFDPADAILTHKCSDGSMMYQISTTNGFRSFKYYAVAITPTTHRIYSIGAIGFVESEEAGKAEQAVVMEFLETKYGSKEKVKPLNALPNAEYIYQYNRGICTQVDGLMPATLIISYIDTDLGALAEKERLAEEIKKADKGGL